MSVQDSQALRGRKIAIRSISFSFSLGIFILVEVVLLSSLSVFAFFSMRESARQLETAYSEQGRELTLALQSNTISTDVGSLARLSANFAAIVNKYRFAGNERPISEIFILRKDGRVLAHSDLSLVTPNSREAINEISAKYNQEFFHGSLSYETNSVQQQDLPKPSGIFQTKNSFLVNTFMSPNVYYSTDFSTVLKEVDRRTRKEKSYATLHVITNRLSVYYYLSAMLQKYFIIFAITFLSGFLITGIILFSFFLRARYIQSEWKRALTYLWENEVIKTEVAHGFQTLSGKLNDIEKRVNQPPPALPQARTQTDILDAILVEPIK
ncbi:MAG: hypothetical protein LDLANPLL_00170 [Turneriella sp.]|nr:hypothetical protein [Turneriella sp.]